jgi:hypothetical protein
MSERHRPYPPDWLSAEEAAYLLTVAESTFRDYVARGLLPKGILIGGSRRWSRHKLNSTLETLEETTLNADGELAAAIQGIGNGAKAKVQRNAA